MLNVPTKRITLKPAMENKEPSSITCVLAPFLIVTLMTLAYWHSEGINRHLSTYDIVCVCRRKSSITILVVIYYFELTLSDIYDDGKVAFLHPLKLIYFPKSSNISYDRPLIRLFKKFIFVIGVSHLSPLQVLKKNLT